MTSLHPTVAQRRADDVDLDLVLEALADPDCRAMIQAADEPRLAKELADACDLPSSTVYRKVDRMSDAGLLREQTRIDSGGHHATEYVSAIESVRLVSDDAGRIDLDVEWKDDHTVEHGSYATYVPADD